MEFDTLICNLNATNVQQSDPKFFTVNGTQLQTPVVGAIDTTASKNVTLTVTKATGADPLILKHFTVELLSDGA